ncbi:MAG: hypothetical protein GXO75_21080 [Calditrichaeota bacterium]|nr:hypothetical protein [Calditrichota bacterium]
MKNYLGEFAVHTKSYIFHPNFMIMNMDVNYKPASRQDNFLVQPDRTEVMTAESGRINVILLQNKPVRGQFYSQYTHNFLNRDYISSLETISYNFGGSISSNLFNLPFSISYVDNKWDQRETLTDRLFKNHHRKFDFRLSRSFSELDQEQIHYSYDKYYRNYLNQWELNSNVNDFELRSNVNLTKKKESSVQSMFRYYTQSGTNSYGRLLVVSNLLVKLPKNFRFRFGIQSLNHKQNEIVSDQNSLTTRLNHRLYQSLRSSVFVEVFQNKHTNYDEHKNREGLYLNYKKRIPFGVLYLNYQLQRWYQDRKSDPFLLQVFREEAELKESQPVLLKYAYVNRNSIRVYDATGTIFYQENIDYILIERDSYIEIQRLPGGEIEEGATVYINYDVVQPQSYTINSYDQNFSAQINLFKGFLEMYYRLNDRSYDQTEAVNYLVFRSFNQKIYGGMITLGPISIGAERDLFDSNIIPYHLKRYYTNISWNLKNRFLVALNGNHREYLMIEENEKQTFSDISSRLYLYLWRNVKIDITAGYRLQKGRGLDLELLTSRGEIDIQYRFLELSFGAEVYRRLYHNDVNDLDRFFVRLERKF